MRDTTPKIAKLTRFELRKSNIQNVNKKPRGSKISTDTDGIENNS